MKRSFVVLTLALLCAALAAWTAGCGGGNGSTQTGSADDQVADGGTADRPDPQGTVSAFWGALSSGDVTKALTYCSDTMRTRAMKNLFNTFFSGEGGEYGADVQEFLADLDLKPVSSEVEADRATVKAEMTAPDLSQIDLVFDQMIGLSADMAVAEDFSDLSPEQIIQQFTLEFVKLLNTLPTATAMQDISLVWEDGAWKITSDPFKDLEQYFIVFQGGA